MARVVNVQSEKDLKRLRKAVEKTFGKSILTQTDCEHLTHDVINKTNVRLSQQTLRRFFGLVASASSASISTLNSLCQFAGYKDWVSFIQAKQKNVRKAEIKTLSGEEILFIKDFYSIQLDVWGDKNFYNASYNIARKIVSSDYDESLLKWLATNPTSQRFFYEYFPYLEGLGGNYINGIKWYLKNAKKEEAKAFGNSLLFLGCFLTTDEEGMETQFHSLKKLEIDVSIHPLPLARLIGNHILYYSKTDRSLFHEWVNIGIHQYLDGYHSNNPKTHCFPGFHFMLADYLLLADEYEKALVVIENFEQIHIHLESFYKPHDSYIEIVKLQKAMALVFSGQEVKGKKLLKEIHPQAFWFFNKKFYWIRYLLLELYLTNQAAVIKRQKLIGEIKSLIAETRFNYFNIYLERYL